jgi:hypothetical protein
MDKSSAFVPSMPEFSEEWGIFWGTDGNICRALCNSENPAY